MRFLVFLGSARDSAPPRPARLGLRVARAALRSVMAAGHEATLVDPLDIATPAIFKPHFAYSPGKAPEVLETLAARIAQSDGHVMVSPEYNHSMSPALMHLLNHFAASSFALRPSLIVTYSAGQWGGARAAMGMRGFLSELGCLPVSAMVHLPRAHEALDEDGCWTGEAPAWDGYMGRGVAQLMWWAEACAARRARGDGPPTPAFARDPAQRDAP
jgi:NAD(P)H-dependent FMN reductase